MVYAPGTLLAVSVIMLVALAARALALLLQL